MNTSRLVVRLNEEQRTAELELMVPHSAPRLTGLDFALRQIGLRVTQMLELGTSRYRVTRVKVAEPDGSELGQTRVMEILCLVRAREAMKMTEFSTRAA